MTTQLVCCLLTALVSVWTGYIISVLTNTTTRNGLDKKTALSLIGLAAIVGGLSYIITNRFDRDMDYLDSCEGTYFEKVKQESNHIEYSKVEVWKKSDKELQIEGTVYVYDGKDTIMDGWFESIDAHQEIGNAGPYIEYSFRGKEGGIQFGNPGDELGPGTGMVTFYGKSKNGRFKFGSGYFDSPVCKCRRNIELIRLTQPWRHKSEPKSVVEESDKVFTKNIGKQTRLVPKPKYHNKNPKTLAPKVPTDSAQNFVSKPESFLLPYDWQPKIEQKQKNNEMQEVDETVRLHYK